MPICENCHADVYATLEITLPNSMKRKNKKRDFRNRKKAKICFPCVRTYARTSLNKNGYWYPIVFPHEIPLKDRKKY